MRFKFLNKKVSYMGYKFDSQAECDRYKELILAERQGEISDLELQKSFEIIPKLIRKEIVKLKTKEKIVYKTEEHHAIYTCDFYYRNKDGTWIIEEFKSPQTAKLTDYILRRKLIKRLISEWNDKGGARYEFREIISHKPKRKKKNADNEGQTAHGRTKS